MADPTKYSQSSNLTYSSLHHLFNEFEDEITCMSGKCMDIGCGPGDVTKDILLPTLDLKAVVVGTDISENMIKHANELYKNEERLNFEVLDIQTKRLPEKYLSDYDHAFAFHSLNWCDDIRQAFENIYRLLRPGGTILALMMLSHDFFDILLKMSQDARYMPYMMNVKNLVPPFYDSIKPHKEMKTLLKNIGFNILHCSQRERSFCVEDAHKLSTLTQSILTEFLKKMPHDLMEQFKDEHAREYTKRRFFYKQIRNENEKIISDLHEIFVLYAQKKKDNYT